MKAKTDTQLFDAYGKAFEFSFQKQKTQEFTKNNGSMINPVDRFL